MYIYIYIVFSFYIFLNHALLGISSYKKILANVFVQS